MCLAVPLKLIKIDGKIGVGELNGLTRDIRLDFIKEPKIGEHLMVHAGFAIERVSEEQAMLDIREWEDVSNAL